jgi:N6-adenosine-specific RNA methylase IME4
MSIDLSEILQILPKDLQYEIEENNQRKDYSFIEKAEIQEKLHTLFQSKFPPGRKHNNASDPEKCQDVDTLASLGMKRVDEFVGKLTGESKETVRKNREIYTAVKKNPDKYNDLIKRVEQRKASLITLRKTVARRENTSTPPLPEGKFDVILADPPWKYQFSQSGAPEDHYPTMETEDICELGKKLPVADDAVLFLWATFPKLEDALQVMKSWGFTYKTSAVWVKEKDNKLQGNGIGHYFRGAAEPILLGIKGKPGTPLPEDRPLNVIKFPKGVHSAKPKIHDSIMKMYQNRKYLEMFSRTKEPIENWQFWGDEVNDGN